MTLDPSPRRRLEEALRTAFPDCRLVIADLGTRHRRHPEAARGSHLHVTLVSPEFEGLGTLARHRLVYARIPSPQSLGVHALALRLESPSEPFPSTPPEDPS